jgi:circadian clock protein KaiC
MAAFIGMLRNQGSTALMIREVAKEVGPELDFSDTPLALLAENLLLFRHVQFKNEIYRILSVLKMRESNFDPEVRQYTVTDQGLKVLGKEDTARGVLAGIARLPAEARAKRKSDEE